MEGNLEMLILKAFVMSMHTFSAPRTPQQNGFVERKNRSLQEMA